MVLSVTARQPPRARRSLYYNMCPRLPIIRRVWCGGSDQTAARRGVRIGAGESGVAPCRCVPAIVERPPRCCTHIMRLRCCFACCGASVMRRHAVECEVASPPGIAAGTIRLRLPRAPCDASSFHCVHSAVLCTVHEVPACFQLRMPWTTCFPRPLSTLPRRCSPRVPTAPTDGAECSRCDKVRCCWRAVVARLTSRARA